MRLKILTVLVLLGGSCIGGELSLAEKLALAKKVADEAAVGKIAAGSVVDGSLNFNDIINKYKKDAEGKKVGEALTSAMDLGANASKESKDEDADEEIKKVFSPKEVLKNLPEPKLEKIAKSEKIDAAEKSVKSDLPQSAEKLYGQKKGNAAEQSSIAEKENADKLAKIAKNDEPKIIPIDEPQLIPITNQNSKKAVENASVKQARQENVQPKEQSKTADISPAKKVVLPDETFLLKGKQLEQAKNETVKKEKLRPVDTSKNFVNGYYIGDGKDAEILKEKIASLEKKQVGEYKNSIIKIFYDTKLNVKEAVQLANYCEDLMKRYFSNRNFTQLYRQIELRILSKRENAALVASELGNNGEIICSAVWTDELKLNVFSHLLSGAVLRAYAYNVGGAKAVKNLPSWLELALQGALEQKARFGVIRDMARMANENPAKSSLEMFSLTSEHNKNDALKKAYAFWHLETLRVILNDKLPDFLEFVIRENLSPLETRKILCKSLNVTERDFELRWRCFLSGIVSSRLSGIQTPDYTRSEIARYAVFPKVNDDGTSIALTGMALFEARENPDIRTAVELRLFEIKVALTRSNFIYYNALVSLGRSLEALLDNDETLYRSSLTDFVNELKTSDIIADIVRRLMFAPSPED